MDRNYFDEQKLSFTRVGLTFLKVEAEDGEVLCEKAEPRRLFPFTDKHNYVSLLAEDGKEVGILRHLDRLSESSRAVVEACLEEYYFIPKVLKIEHVEEKNGAIHFRVITDKGPCVINISFTVHQFRMLSPTWLLITDNNYNRYEIPDINALPPESRRIMRTYL